MLYVLFSLRLGDRELNTKLREFAPSIRQSRSDQRGSA